MMTWWHDVIMSSSQRIPGGDLVENHCFIEVKFSDVCRFSDFLVEIICHHVILSSCHHVIMSSCHHVIMSSCSCHHFMMSWCHLRKSWKINDIVKSQLTFQVHLLGLLGKTGFSFFIFCSTEWKITSVSEIWRNVCTFQKNYLRFLANLDIFAHVHENPTKFHHNLEEK